MTGVHEIGLQQLMSQLHGTSQKQLEFMLMMFEKFYREFGICSEKVDRNQ